MIHRGRGKVCPLFKKGPFYRSVSTLMSLIVPQSVRVLHRGIAEVRVWFFQAFFWKLHKLRR